MPRLSVVVADDDTSVCTHRRATLDRVLAAKTNHELAEAFVPVCPRCRISHREGSWTG